MRAMMLEHPNKPLQMVEKTVPVPGPGQLLIRVKACGVCRTDLHLVDGDLPDPKLPVIPGHEVVGEVAGKGEGVSRFQSGQRVGVPWLGHTCGQCCYCQMKRENLCDHPGFTGYTLDGGYAEFMVADASYCFPLPDNYDDLHAA
ncbi:MAG TPA: alcohol dehydrogenase, partial [Anaerolineae bacterium]|nr:alcohol dehydrogenase [Anaerolineae bacterium]